MKQGGLITGGDVERCILARNGAAAITPLTPPPSIAVLGILKHALANLTALCLDVENKEQLAQTWEDEKSSGA